MYASYSSFQLVHTSICVLTPGQKLRPWVFIIPKWWVNNAQWSTAVGSACALSLRMMNMEGKQNISSSHPFTCQLSPFGYVHIFFKMIYNHGPNFIKNTHLKSLRVAVQQQIHRHMWVCGTFPLHAMHNGDEKIFLFPTKKNNGILNCNGSCFKN